MTTTADRRVDEALPIRWARLSPAQREALTVLVRAATPEGGGRQWVAGTKRRSISNPRVEVNIRATDALVKHRLARWRDKRAAAGMALLPGDQFISTFEYSVTAAGISVYAERKT